MAAENASAIVLRVVEFSESSCVVTLFTREFGKIGALAKGARRLKNPFDSALDVLAVCRLVFLRKSSGGLDLLTEAKLQWRFRPYGRELAPLYAGYYVAELLLQLTDEYDPHPELFDTAIGTLERLAEKEVDVAAEVLRFELISLRLLGHLPNLDRCVECSEPIAVKGRIAFGQLAGGVLCAKCRPGKKLVVSVTAAAIETMRRFAGLEVPLRGELRGVINHYVSHLIGHQPKLHRYLNFSAGSSSRSKPG